MNTLAVTLTVILGIILIAMLVVSIWLLRSWRSLPQRVQRDYRREVYAHRTTLLALSALMLIPSLIYLYIQLNINPIPVSLAGVLLWVGIAIWFREKRVKPLNKTIWEDDETRPSPYIPRPTVKPSMPLAPVPIPKLTEGDLVHKSFTWTYTLEEWTQTIEMDISQVRFEDYHQEERLPVKDWAHYVTEDMPEVRVLAIHFQNLHLQREWCTFEQASNVLSFSQQCIPYMLDEETTSYPEWPRYPIETLMEEAGDCEDAATLTAAVLARLGFQVALLEYPGHVALGVAGADGLPGDYVHDRKNGKRYFYAEATADGWHIGEIPKEYRGMRPKRIIPIEILVEKEIKLEEN